MRWILETENQTLNQGFTNGTFYSSLEMQNYVI